MNPAPYTHQLHAARCAAAAQSRQILSQYVQVKRQGVTHCGRIAGAWTSPDGVDLWVIDLVGPLVGRHHFGVKFVTQCSGLDGHCQCAGERP